MGKHRQAAKIDNSQSDIVSALRQIPGVEVEVGHDDILVGFRGYTFWYELKNPEDVSPKTGEIIPSKITGSEKRRLEHFTGHYRIVWSIDQIMTDLRKVMRDRRAR